MKLALVGTVGVVMLTTFFVVVSYVRMLLQRATLPPGPFPWPIVGNVLQFPRSKPWLQFKAWSRANGNGLLTVWIGRTPAVICNDAWSASELMEKRSNIYSSRPNYVIFGDLTDQAVTNQVLLPYNDHWRLQRRVMHMALGSQAIHPYRTFQADESRVLMRDLLNDPLNFAHHFERYACSLVSILGWGRRIDNQEDYILKFALKMMDEITMIQVPGEYWIETIPELQYLPTWLYALPNQLSQFGKVLRKFWWALDNEAAQSDKQNFSKTLIKMKDQEGLSDDAIAEMTTNLIGGGLDTTSSTLHTLVLGLCLFPEALKTAHEEVDRVIGQERAPDWDDLDNLPYCLSVMKEAMRWRSVTTMGGFAHAPIKDDTYRGYHFPAGIPVYGNLWAIHSDPNDFPDPDMFKPERHLEENRRPYPNKTGHNAFGWGRRSCSGRYFAEQGLSMTIVRLMWAYDILPGLDENGKPVKLDMWAYTDNENTQPLPFKARFIPRSEKIRNLIEEEAVMARERLTAWDGKSNVTVEQFI
ncbi:cytochrome P450 [Cadophora sp. DSE1049]|nr:cytochrome P450 [Cadophora sp. DSE1049]